MVTTIVVWCVGQCRQPVYHTYAILTAELSLRLPIHRHCVAACIPQNTTALQYCVFLFNLQVNGYIFPTYHTQNTKLLHIILRTQSRSHIHMHPVLVQCCCVLTAEHIQMHAPVFLAANDIRWLLAGSVYEARAVMSVCEAAACRGSQLVM